MSPRLLADENTSHRLVKACQGLAPDFPLIHLAVWRDGLWLGLVPRSGGRPEGWFVAVTTSEVSFFFAEASAASTTNGRPVC